MSEVAVGAQAAGIAQGALDHGLRYVQERQQFGKATADFRDIQFMLADMAMKRAAARHLTYVAAGRSERDEADLAHFGAKDFPGADDA